MICIRREQNATGFTLIEVLVSVLVLTVGLIGAALMQLHAFRTTAQSNFHDTAVTLAMQIADEIRANNIEMNKSTGPNPFIPLTYKASSSPGTTTTNCYTGACSSAEMAAQNIVEWKRRVQLVLPNGRLDICRDSAPVDSSGDFVWCASGTPGPAFGPIAIKVGWSERDPGLDTSGTLASVVQPPQVALLVMPLSQ